MNVLEVGLNLGPSKHGLQISRFIHCAMTPVEELETFLITTEEGTTWLTDTTKNRPFDRDRIIAGIWRRMVFFPRSQETRAAIQK